MSFYQILLWLLFRVGARLCVVFSGWLLRRFHDRARSRPAQVGSRVLSLVAHKVQGNGSADGGFAKVSPATAVESPREIARF